MNIGTRRLSWSWPRVRRASVTTLLVFTAMCSGVYAVGNAQHRSDGLTTEQQVHAAPLSNLSTVFMLVSIGCAVALVWRHRWPVWVSLAISALTIALPLDGLTPLLALYAVVLGVAGRWMWASVALAAVAEVVSVWRDGGGTRATSWWRTLFGMSDRAGFPWWLVLLVSALAVGVTCGLAVLVRSRRALRSSQAKETRTETQLHQLGEEVARQAERERIAREVHDVLGHRLSLLAIHAGALEVASPDNSAIARSAALVREGAQSSMQDLRSLLSVLRQPGDADVAAAVPGLRDLSPLIDECLVAGTPVASSIFVDQSVALDQRVGHSAYRITQELLTNARRHAPGRPVRLQVDARPEAGVEVSTVNASPHPHDRRINPGNGLTGLHERVQQAGGQSWVWVDDDGNFRTLVRLPWVWNGGQSDE